MIQTERLILRQWRDSDHRPFSEMSADPEVMAYFPAMLTQTESDALALKQQNRIEQNGFGFWAVERRDNQAFIGFVGLNRPDYPLPFAPCLEIGWRLARSAWGFGFAYEAAQAALRFGFEVLKQNEIVSFTSKHNERSQNVMRRLGMRRDLAGDFLHPKLSPEHWLAPHVLYRLSKANWHSTQMGQ